ncbi:hypothetical protein VTK56DRAFT_8634 [Thermocarpiscus australiensis]
MGNPMGLDWKLTRSRIACSGRSARENSTKANARTTRSACGALDNVDVVDLADFSGEEINDLLFGSVSGQATDKDRTTVDIVLAQELLVGVDARDSLLPLAVESFDAVRIVITDNLWDNVSMVRM